MPWLRELNGGIAARRFYPPEHPRVLQAMQSLESLSRDLLQNTPEVSFFVIDGRLACDGKLVPGAESLVERAFEGLREHGYDCFTLMRGVTAAEMAHLVTVCAGKAAVSEMRTHPPTDHIRFSVFDGGEGREEVGQALAMTVQALPSIWASIDERRCLDSLLLESALQPLVEMFDAPQGSTLALEALTSHDDYTATHIANVAVLSMALAQSMGWGREQSRQLGVAALLHDIGKMKVPPEILKSTGRLKPEELVLIRQHPEAGARMLLGSAGVPRLAAIVAYEHHLHADGGGYPTVPAGWTIHPGSAITHVVDVYDALRTNRPYRAGLDHEVIVDMMAKDRERVFPPRLLDVFFAEVVPRAQVDPPLPPDAIDVELTVVE
jgi:putative nucleotidyltransferase with HDIG domain